MPINQYVQDSEILQKSPRTPNFVNQASSKCFPSETLYGKVRVQSESEVKERTTYFHKNLIIGIYLFSTFYQALYHAITQGKLRLILDSLLPPSPNPDDSTSKISLDSALFSVFLLCLRLPSHLLLKEPPVPPILYHSNPSAQLQQN